jgi:hypothetical protein
MPTRRERWLADHQQALSRKVHLRVDGGQVEPGPHGSYNVTIEGFGLYPAIVPPRVVVGGVPAEQLQFRPDGRTIRGILRQRPSALKVVVDYGFARAEWEAVDPWPQAGATTL